MSAAEGAPRRRRWLPWLFGASLCLNLLLFGAAAGLALRGWGPSAAELPAGFDRVTLWRVYKSLPQEDQDAVRGILRGYRGELRALADAREGARREIAARLEARPFSGPDLAAALAAARLHEGESRALIDVAFVEFAGRLAPELREEIADALRDAHERRGWRRWRDRE